MRAFDSHGGGGAAKTWEGTLLPLTSAMLFSSSLISPVEEPQTTTFDDLPLDVLGHIVALVGDPETLLSLSHTCSTLHKIIRSVANPPHVWNRCGARAWGGPARFAHSPCRSPSGTLDWVLSTPERLFSPGPAGDFMQCVVKRERRGPFSRFTMSSDRKSFVPLPGKKLLVAYHIPGSTRIFSLGFEVATISGVTGSAYSVRRPRRS